MSSTMKLVPVKELTAKDKLIERQRRQIDYFKLQHRRQQRVMNKDDQVESLRKEVDNLKVRREFSDKRIRANR